ncbi:uncharacterized protein LOC117110272 isoform X2 [Anneissia japonica]|uniref:uncharacterized protein LOC117110272 isoform X2 n=1 Tax=Anneissia japonica TaxID=1529436 RepID=UPI001425644B|nr:uncharacterized protein LOC117110272 isoform X2 [Anneissia japonica]
MQSPTAARKALFDTDLQQALSLLDREQAKLGTPLTHSYSRTRTNSSFSNPVASPCLYKSHSMDSGLSSISISSKMSGVPESSSLTFNVQIPVKHYSASGTQAGSYYPKYQVYKESKCISCQDCSIFFSPSAFLKHCHDKKLGTRVECNATQLELATDNPGIHQKKLWEEFQSKISGNGMQIYGEKDRILKSSPVSFRSSGKTYTDNRFHWKTNGSSNSLNGTIHNDVLASRRLLQSTQNIIQGSAEKARRRYDSRKDIMSSVSHLTDESLEFDVAKQPVIKVSSSSVAQPSARKSLQKYLSDGKDFKLGSLKLSDSSLLSDNMTSARFLDNEISTYKLDDPRDDPSEKKAGQSFATSEQKLMSSYAGSHGDNKSDDNHHGDLNKEDPLKILQTAQELLHLASASLQKQQSQSVIDWEERYQSEKKLRRKVEQKLFDTQAV